MKEKICENCFQKIHCNNETGCNLKDHAENCKKRNPH